MPPPAGGRVGPAAVQPKTAPATRMPPVPPPAGGRVGPAAVQPKTAPATRMPPVPAPAGGRVGPAAVSNGVQAVQRARAPGAAEVVQKVDYTQNKKFKYDDGDLIYGLSRGRTDTVMALDPSRDTGIVNEVIIDDLNNQFIGTGEFGTGRKRSFPDNNEGNDFTDKAHAFRTYLENHPRYDPNLVGHKNLSVTRVKRACKGGIEYTLGNGNRIHFVLDGIDMDMVVNKTGPYDLMGMTAGGDKSRDITGAELRWLYRHRKDPRVKKQVYFWKDGERVDAPWEEESRLWKGYTPQNEVPRKKKKKGCFLTTACVEARGLPDDCQELTVLRAFRDGYLRARPGGPALIATYERVAPRIVARIAREPDAAAILARVYAFVEESVARIFLGDLEGALRGYRAMVRKLDRRFLRGPRRRRG